MVSQVASRFYGMVEVPIRSTVTAIADAMRQCQGANGDEGEGCAKVSEDHGVAW
jgi:hypothetical protein